MKKWFLLLVSVLLLVSLPLSVLGETQQVVNVFNWEEYICEDVIELFEKETGIKVNYMRFTRNEDMMMLVEAGYTGDSSPFDVIMPSDYCVERLIKKDLLQEIDYSKLTNFNQINPSLLNPGYDPENKYSVPYMWGTVGILYNKTLTGEDIDSWGVLFDKKHQNDIFMLDSYRDSIGVALKYLGYSMNSTNFIELEEAGALLVEQKKNGIAKAYQVDETKDKMINNEAAIAVMWSGDAINAMRMNPNLTYVVPKEGSNIWVDAMVVPKGAQNYDNALTFIDFLCRPDIAQMNCEEIDYSSPNLGAIALMGSDYIDFEAINPSEETVARCEVFVDVYDVLPIYVALWNEVANTK